MENIANKSKFGWLSCCDHMRVLVVRVRENRQESFNSRCFIFNASGFDLMLVRFGLSFSVHSFIVYTHTHTQEPKQKQKKTTYMRTVEHRRDVKAQIAVQTKDKNEN